MLLGHVRDYAAYVLLTLPGEAKKGKGGVSVHEPLLSIPRVERRKDTHRPTRP